MFLILITLYFLNGNSRFGGLNLPFEGSNHSNGDFDIRNLCVLSFLVSKCFLHPLIIGFMKVFQIGIKPSPDNIIRYRDPTVLRPLFSGVIRLLMASFSLRCVLLVELPCWLAVFKLGHTRVEVIGDLHVCHFGQIILDIKRCNSLLELRVVDFLK